MRRLISVVLIIMLLPLAACAERIAPAPTPSGGVHVFQVDAETGYTIIEKDGLYGAADKDGNIVVPCSYIQPFYFSCGIALVRGEQFTYIDTQGQPITDRGWTYAFPFMADYALVCEDGLYGLIDKNGNTVLKCVYEPW